MGKVAGGHILTVQHFWSAPSVSVMIPPDNSRKTVSNTSCGSSSPCVELGSAWSFPHTCFCSLACTLWCEVSNQDWSACLSLSVSPLSSSPPYFSPSSGCCEERQPSHMSVLFWLCGSWLCWAPFCLPLWSPPRGLRTQRARRQRRRTTTAGSPCRRSTYPISSTTTRSLPSSAARTHAALLK